MRLLPFTLALSVSALALGCAADDPTQDADESDFTSAVSTLLDFEFDGELVMAAGAGPRGSVRAQLLYMVGHLNAEGGAPRLGKVTLTNLVTTVLPNGLSQLRYHAKLPVAWPSKTSLPSSYEITVPKRTDSGGQAEFLKKYAPTCADEPSDANVSNYWYHYRPRLAGCQLAPADVTRVTAKVTKSPLNAVAKYPEYHRVWEDDSLDVVAVFGKYEEGATGLDDAGVEAYSRFIGAMKKAFPQAATTPAALGEVGAKTPDVSFDLELANGRSLHLTALLVDKVATAPASFDARFGELTPGADLVLYAGHAGLGANMKALTTKARFFPQKYQLFFIDGCDTFAYEDDSLQVARAALNPDDQPGSKYLDVMLNAMPAYFSSMPDASMAVIQALVNDAQPKTYETIFKGIDAAQNVAVVGEEDNQFSPSLDLGKRWDGFFAAGSVTYKEQKQLVTGELPAGKYVFSMVPEPTAPGGDADVYLKVGGAPTIDKASKCPSYKANSNERCFVTLKSPSKVYMTVIGDKQTSSEWMLRGFQRIE